MNTIIKLKGYIPATEIVTFMQNNMKVFPKIIGMHTKNCGNNQNNQQKTVDICLIEFFNEKGLQSIYYNHSNFKSYLGLQFYAKRGLEELATSETTVLTMQYSAEGLEIMKNIVQHFGGWIDENDSDDIIFYPVFKKEETIQETQQKVAMNANDCHCETPETHNQTTSEMFFEFNHGTKFWVSGNKIRFEKKEDCNALVDFLKHIGCRVYTENTNKSEIPTNTKQTETVNNTQKMKHLSICV